MAAERAPTMPASASAVAGVAAGAPPADGRGGRGKARRDYGRAVPRFRAIFRRAVGAPLQWTGLGLRWVVLLHPAR